MTRQDAAREIKSRYAEYMTPARKPNTYVCPICGNGTGSSGDGMSVDPHRDGFHLKCFKCGEYGDIIDFYQKEHGCSFMDAFTALCDRFKLDVDYDRAERPQTASNGTGGINVPQAQEKAVERTTEPLPDFLPYMVQCMRNITDPRAQEYMTGRGISRETAIFGGVGFDPKENRIIIPCGESYVARSIDPAAMRYKNPAGRPVELFQLEELKRDDTRPIFLVEGAIDALSIIEAGGRAIGLNSTSNVPKLLEYLKKNRTQRTFILCLDADKAGREAEGKLADGLRELNIAFVTANICGGHKDPNEALTSNRAAFIEAVAATERDTVKPDNTKDYITRVMESDIDHMRAQRFRSTGFVSLDRECGSIYSGLYVVGGISSVGKTTFISQLADQMAAYGQQVLFFSMEQSRLEMVSKSIARIAARLLPGKSPTSLQIRTGCEKEIVGKAIAAYTAAVGDRVSIIEGNFNCTVSFIRDYTRQYIERNGVKPVVIVDYLQVLQPDKDPDTGRKPTDTQQILDTNVTNLKRISRTFDIPVFVISSLNRSNYLTPMDFEALKGSGGLEYTADVVWGLQLAAVYEAAEKDSIADKRKVIAEAKEAEPREIELVCLKNRYGKSRYTVPVTYYPQYDLFIER